MPGQTPTSTHYSYLELGEQPYTGDTLLAAECALSISYNGLNQAVMMVSPSDLEDFLYGFSLTAGLVESAEEIYDIQLSAHGEALVAQLQVSSRAFWALKQQRRQLAGSTGCGLCGVEALQQALPQLATPALVPLPAITALHGLRQRISDHQLLARQSGALHAALFVDDLGEIRLCREDLGRHNALDKLIGAIQRQRLETQGGFVVVTSRCSLELIHKVVRAGLGTLVSLSAPSELAVQWARRHNLNLLHLPHYSAPRVYSPAPAS